MLTNIRRSELCSANIKSYLMPKVESTLKLSNYYVTTQNYICFPHKIPNAHAVFLEILVLIGPEIWHNCFVSPCPAVRCWRMGYSIFSSEVLDLLRPKYPPRIQLQNVWRKKNVNAWVYHAKFRGLSPKNGVNIACWTDFGAIFLNQPVILELIIIFILVWKY